MADDNVLDKLKLILREKDCPFFEDEELLLDYNENGGNLNLTLYQCFQLKAEDTTLSVSGLNCGDTSKYFRRMAQRYRKNNSCILSGG